MTFEVGEMLNYLTDAFLKAPIVNTIAKNPIYTALVVTLAVILIIMLIFRDIEADETVLTMALRTGFWVFLMLLGVLMIHNRVLFAESNQSSRDGQYDHVFTQSKVGQFEPDFVPVQPQQPSSGYGMSRPQPARVMTSQFGFQNPPSINPQQQLSTNSGLAAARVE
jgi:hypothetical protein